jgi:hypothetical protein
MLFGPTAPDNVPFSGIRPRSGLDLFKWLSKVGECYPSSNRSVKNCGIPWDLWMSYIA